MWRGMWQGGNLATDEHRWAQMWSTDRERINGWVSACLYQPRDVRPFKQQQIDAVEILGCRSRFTFSDAKLQNCRFCDVRLGSIEGLKKGIAFVDVEPVLGSVVRPSRPLSLLPTPDTQGRTGIA